MNLSGGLMRGQVRTLRRQFLDEINRVFAPREILLRSNGRVKCITINRRQQIAVASLATAVVGWSVLATAGTAISLYLWSNRGVQLQQTSAAYAALSAEVAASRNHLAALSDEVVAARTRFAELAQALSADQKFMLDLARDQRAAPERAPVPPIF